ncbi:hypothetical protein EUGRSUZ_L03576 [Eucalyptus grandis]|uniref:Germin-like protein n=1 Tax=Eucalyptus grandis TaxID=71139 RepID=A0AAD9T7V0_EUCGR|nr:hypothetical protein EUGRSUZ_L03576 [Eucalyptus grandis]
MAKSVLLICFLGLVFAFAAADNSPLQDFCVAEAGSSVLVNGQACKDPKTVQANNFSFIPRLNTLGISMARIDIAPWGINPPHTHPRASEILLVLEGTLEVGFITSNPDNRLISKILQKGDVFVFPQGLIHYQRNTGFGNAVAIAALGSENPGVITIANVVFGSMPDISVDILAKAFKVDKTVVGQIQSKF